jgi:hypothetical protein
VPEVMPCYVCLVVVGVPARVQQLQRCAGVVDMLSPLAHAATTRARTRGCGVLQMRTSGAWGELERDREVLANDHRIRSFEPFTTRADASFSARNRP